MRQSWSNSGVRGHGRELREIKKKVRHILSQLRVLESQTSIVAEVLLSWPRELHNDSPSNDSLVWTLDLSLDSSGAIIEKQLDLDETRQLVRYRAHHTMGAPLRFECRRMMAPASSYKSKLSEWDTRIRYTPRFRPNVRRLTACELVGSLIPQKSEWLGSPFRSRSDGKSSSASRRTVDSIGLKIKQSKFKLLELNLDKPDRGSIVVFAVIFHAEPCDSPSKGQGGLERKWLFCSSTLKHFIVFEWICLRLKGPLSSKQGKKFLKILHICIRSWFLTESRHFISSNYNLLTWISFEDRVACVGAASLGLIWKASWEAS